jgi:hypothetical protein
MKLLNKKILFLIIILWNIGGYVSFAQNINDKSEKSENIFNFIKREFPPPPSLINIKNCKELKISVVDSVLKMEKNNFTFEINYSINRESTFLINKHRIDSIYAGNTNYFDINLNEIPLDLENICYFSFKENMFFLIPISTEGCMGNSCHFLMYFLVSYNQNDKLFKAFYFSTSFSQAYHFTILKDKLYFVDINNSADEPMLLTNLLSNYKTNIEMYEYYFINKFQFDESNLKWVKKNIEYVFKAKIDPAGNINNLSFINISNKLKSPNTR